VLVLLVHDGGGVGYAAPAPTATATAQPPSFRSRAGSRLTITSWAQAYATAATLVGIWRPDVLHLHVFRLWLLAAALRRDTGVPVVYTVHSLDRAEYEIGHGPPECLTQWQVQAATINGADRVIALTRSEQQRVAAYCPCAAMKLRVVGNGIAVPTAAPPRRPSTGNTMVLFTGRFVDRKGIAELLAAIPEVLSACPRSSFVLAGGQRGHTAKQTDRWWRPEHLRGCARIQFTGWLNANQMAAWYRRVDVLVVPSWYEPFGMVILEGMLHGLAIAAADVGGPAEILTHDVTGLLFPPRHVTALAEILIQLLTSAALRRRLGEAGRSDVARFWAWPRIITQIHAVYTELAPTRAEYLR
jgi:glycogen(starch) synthase